MRPIHFVAEPGKAFSLALGFAPRGSSRKSPAARGASQAEGPERLPENLQDVTFRVFNALVDPEALKTLGTADGGGQAPLNGFVKSGLLARVNADVGEFENYGCPVAGCFNGSVAQYWLAGNFTVKPSSAVVR